MTIRHSQTGVGHILAVLAVVVVAVAGFAGYTVLKADQKKSSDSAVVTPAAGTTGAIKTKADLDATATFLDSTSTQLDQDLDASTLNSDIDQLL